MMLIEETTVVPTLFKLKKSVKGACQAARCRDAHVLEISGELWRVGLAKLCEKHAAEALVFAEARPDYAPPQTVFSPEEKADLMHLRAVAEEIKLVAREGDDVLGIARNFEIETQADLVRVNDWLHGVAEKRKEIAEKEKFCTEPFTLGLSRLRALFRPAKQYWADAEIVLRRKISLARTGEAERNEAAMQKAAEAAASGDSEGAVAALAEIAHVSELEGTGIVDFWEFEVVDVNKMPPEYTRLVPDLGLIKMYANRAQKEGFEPEIEGVKFVKGARPVVRTAK
jgi:hypothetical protein